MTLRLRHLSLFLALGALAACSAESVTGASAGAELPQPRPAYSVAGGDAAAPAPDRAR